MFTAKTSDRPVIDRNISPSTLDFLNMSSSSKLALLAFNYEFQFMFWFWTAIVNDNYTSKSAVFHSDICFSQRTPSVFHREYRLFFTENTSVFQTWHCFLQQIHLTDQTPPPWTSWTCPLCLVSLELWILIYVLRFKICKTYLVSSLLLQAVRMEASSANKALE